MRDVRIIITEYLMGSYGILNIDIYKAKYYVLENIF